MVIIDGKKYRDELLEEYKTKIKKENLKIRLDIIQVGDNSESDVYVRNKIKYAKYVGIEPILHHLDEDATEAEILDLIRKLNEDKEVTGIILQSPVPKGLDFDSLAEEILPSKDIDGFTRFNVNKLYHNEENLLPCTVLGVIKLLEHYDIQIEGADIVIVGRGNIVGKPLALALSNRNATVTLAHSHTKDLKSHISHADIVISAAGKRALITGDMVKAGSVLIDVGISVQNGHLYGDIDMDSVKDKAGFVTPVPGGVGPMTVAMIINNLILAKTKEDEKDG